MRLVADESIERRVILRLREVGHDVRAVVEQSPRAHDAQVLAGAHEDGRLLLTSDKDFAELAFLQRAGSSGIVLLRMPRAKADAKAVRLEQALRELGTIASGAMIVVEPDVVRIRSLPDPMR
jgi:predicted nuclease of predicted toxin-antitoxin system